MSRILVVEDDDATRYAMGRVLADADYEVSPKLTTTKMHCRSWRAQVQVDLLLVDLVMPGVNGFALARMARMRRHNIKVVYVTGYDDLPVQEAVGPILRKPVMPDTLVATVRRELSATV